MGLSAAFAASPDGDPFCALNNAATVQINPATKGREKRIFMT